MAVAEVEQRVTEPAITVPSIREQSCEESPLRQIPSSLMLLVFASSTILRSERDKVNTAKC